MKKIFVYYSLTGNGEKVSEYLSSKEIETRKVEIKKNLPKSFFLKIIVGGFRALREYKDELLDFNNNIDDYDEIIIGSPIWNGRLSTPINSVLEQLNLQEKKVCFVFYSGSGTSPKATEKIKKLLPEASIIDLKEPKKDNEELKKLDVL